MRLMIALASLLLSATFAASAEPIKLCTGSDNGVYYAAGKEIAAMSGVPVSVGPSRGTVDNMHRTLDLPKSDPESCDAFIGQPDGPVYRAAKNKASLVGLRMLAPLHREYLHVICNKQSGVSDLGDLEDDPTKYSVAVGPEGSGAWLIWQNIIAEDSDYGQIPTSPENGILALTSVASGDTTCMLVPAGLGDGTVGEADQTFGDSVVLVGANDSDFNDAQTADGKPLYEWAKIPGSAYPKSFNYWSSPQTISWNAGLYLNTEKVADRQVQAAFATAAARAAVGIKAKYGR